MMARRGVLGLLAGGAAMLLGACGLRARGRYRFRLTIAVDTPQGARTGSSVYEIKANTTGNMLPDAAKRRWSVRGEAVAVDLPGGRTLFVLLKTGAHFDDMAGLSMNTLHPAFREEGYDIVGVVEELASGNHPGPAEVAHTDYPMLVTFTNINDPASVELVEPANLAASFGPGVRLKAVTAELTDDAVTDGIEERLGWLAAVGRQRMSLRKDVPRYRHQMAPIHKVKIGDFSTELYK